MAKKPAKDDVKKPVKAKAKAEVQDDAAVEKPAKKAKAPKATPEEKAEKKKAAAVARQEKADAAAASEDREKWLVVKEKHGKDKAANYSMKAQFEANQPIQHKTLGWGFVVANNNDRLEVLFETGMKILISNYQA